MSNAINVIQGLINNALMQTHTAFCGKVIRLKNGLADVQPLNMVKAKGGVAQKQAVITNVPILQPTYNYVVKYNGTNCTVTPALNIKQGDTVYCVCTERDITETRKGRYATPVQGRHMLSDAVIVGKF